MYVVDVFDISSPCTRYPHILILMCCYARYLDSILTAGIVTELEAIATVSAIAANSKGKHIVWTYLMTHWDYFPLGLVHHIVLVLHVHNHIWVIAHVQQILILVLCLLHWVHILHIRYVACFVHSFADMWCTTNR